MARFTKWLALCLCAVLMVPALAAAEYTAGAYTAVSEGHNGALTVEVTFAEDKIESVTVTEHVETAGIADPALEKIPEEIVAGQTLAVDTVSGATVTSEAILAGVENCVVQAGGDVEALKVAAQADDAERTQAEYETDVVVVGGGIAGLMAANKAADEGAQVMVLEKMPATGGTTSLALAAFIAVDSGLNVEEGMDDGIDAMMTYWEAVMSQGRDTSYPDYDKVRDVLGDSGKSIDYMVENGVPFMDSISGMLGSYPIALVEGRGPVLIESLEQAARDKGVEVLLECEATELLVEDGVVVGVKAAGASEDVTVRAKSVVLATGGFSRNEEMVAELTPDLLEVRSQAAVSSTGDGMRMAQAVGGAMFPDSWATIYAMQIDGDYTRSIDVTLPNATQLGVNGKGERYASEVSQYMSSLTHTAVVEANYPYFFLYDGSNEELIPALETGIELGESFKGETIEELAAAMGVDAQTLTATVDRYNELAGKGEDEDFGKPAESMIALAAEGPYYAVKFYPVSFGSMGGLITDSQTCSVLDADGNPIANLFAAGEISNRDFYNEHYVGAASLAFYSTMGGRAGVAAAANAK